MSKFRAIVSGIRALLYAAMAVGILAATASADAVDVRISMTMQDAELEDVMDMISREQRVNVFVSTEVNETVSFSLYDMSVPQAIHAIANAAGMAVEQYNGNYFVIDRDDAGKYHPDALTQVDVFELQYIRADEIEALLTPYLSDYGEITVFQDRNLFMVEDTPGFLRRIAMLKREIDRPPTQILIKARILEITLTDEDSYGLDWSNTFTSGDGSGDFGTQGLADSTSAGFQFNFADARFSATLSALTSQGRVRTLSSPTLLATEHMESSVIVGDRRGYSVVTTINQVTTESIEFLESGVILRVTPSVDADDQIMLDIHPEVSTGIIDPTSGIPSQTTTEVTTRMIIPDGQTVFVGGLIKHRVEESRSGVPVLGRVPGVGRLFSRQNDTTTNTETVVLITPTIVRNGAGLATQDVVDRIERLDDGQERRNRALSDELDRLFDPSEKE